MSGLYEFVAESNRIEGIGGVAKHDLEAHTTLLSCVDLNVEDLERFVATVAGAELRRKPGMNVRVGPHLPLGGGPQIEHSLREILVDAHAGESPYAVHVAYETLHPFMDGNGRSGRALWAWMMRRQGRDPFVLGFLHRWYYDSLGASRGGSDLSSTGDTVSWGSVDA